jgi:hypothetical protein
MILMKKRLAKKLKKDIIEILIQGLKNQHAHL